MSGGLKEPHGRHMIRRLRVSNLGNRKASNHLVPPALRTESSSDRVPSTRSGLALQARLRIFATRPPAPGRVPRVFVCHVYVLYDGAMCGTVGYEMEEFRANKWLHDKTRSREVRV